MTVLALVLTACAANTQQANEYPETLDGLNRVDNAKVTAAYLDPTADFSIYKRVKILNPAVEFRDNWQRDQNRYRTGRKITDADVERIQNQLSGLFVDVFTEVLEKGQGYEITEEEGADVLLLRPAIINLDVAAPDLREPGRVITLTQDTGSATLYLELYDSASSKMIGRAIDRRISRGTGDWITLTNSVTNQADARRVLRRWADLLRTFLDDYYPGQGK